MNVAMAGALEATIQRVRGPKGERSIPIGDFHLLAWKHTAPGDRWLEPGDLITHVTLPPSAPLGNRSLYLNIARPNFL